MADYIMEHDVPSDYVRRDDVIDNAGSYVSVGTLISIANNGLVKLSDIEPHIEDAVPLSAVIGIAAADVRENVRGELVESDIDPDYVMCSECKNNHDPNRMSWQKSYFKAIKGRFKFCPICGADMRRGKKDG